MDEAEKHNVGTCRTGCGECMTDPATGAGGPAGWGLAVRAATAFLLPLALAVAAAASAGSGGAAQLLRGLTGLAVGAGAAAAVGGALRRRGSDDNTANVPRSREDR